MASQTFALQLSVFMSQPSSFLQHRFPWFHLQSDRLLLLILIPLTLIMRITDPYPDQIGPFHHYLSITIIACILLFLALSYLNSWIQAHFYYVVLIIINLFGLDITASLYLFRFNGAIQTGYILYLVLLPWYLRSQRDLLIFQLLHTLIPLLIFSGDLFHASEANWFLLGVLAINGFTFFIVGEHIRKAATLSQKGVVYKHVIEQLNDGVLILDKKGKIMMVNQQFCELIGYRAEELIGRMHLSSMISKENRQVLVEHLRDRKSGKASTHEMRFRRKDGEVIWLSLSTQPHVDGEGHLLGSISIVADITRRKATEEARDRYAEHLQEVNNELEATNLELAQFAQIVATDLKAPLHEMAERVQQAQQLPKEALPKRLPGLTRPLAQTANYLAALLDALWQYAYSSSRSLNHQRVDPQAIIQEIQRDLLIRDHQLRLHPLPALYGDQWQIKHLFYHLIDNATKFSPEGSPISIEAKPASQAEQDVCTICIKDQGQGVPSAYHENVFLIFQKGLAQNQNGMGLGLAICKKIVHNHGGHIWLDASQTEGTHVYFTLPLAREEKS